MLWPYRGKCLLAVLTVGVQVGYYLVLPLAYQQIFDRGIADKDSVFLWQLLGALAFGFVAVTIADLVLGYLAASLGSAIVNDLRLAMFQRLQGLSDGFFARTATGDLLSRFSNDLNAVDRAVSNSLYQALLFALLGLSSVVVLFFVEWRLACVTLVALPIAALGPEIFGGRAVRAGQQKKEQEADLSGLVHQSIRGQLIVQAFGLQAAMVGRFHEHIGRLYYSSVWATLFSSFAGKTSNLGVLLVQLLVIGVGAFLALEGFLSAGMLIGFIGLLLNVGDATTQLTALFPDLVQATVGLRRIDELLDESEDEAARADLPQLAPFNQRICFEHVGFSYDGDKPNLQDVSFCIDAGESVAFVGRSGSGKSTILNLLAGFYRADAGRITIDGCDLQQRSRQSLRAQMAPVFQDTCLFDMSVRENIRQGRLEATDVQVEHAARLAEVHDVIEDLVDGYDTSVGEGGTPLSGGQRQRIALARALLREPRILILDEATSALDPRTEAAVNGTLDRLAGTRTLISVTHRLSSAVNVDRILVMEEGRLIEQGSHKDLLNHKGTYYDMWQEYSLELTQNAIVGDVAAGSTPTGEHQDALEREIERLQGINQRWAQLAGTDRLTGLPNKMSLLQALLPDQIQQARRRQEPVGLLLLSGDNFGPINETHGRDVGDAVLRQLAQRLQQVLHGEELLAHLDGTYFAVVLFPANLQQARQRAGELRLSISGSNFDCAEAQIKLTLSAAVASLDSSATGDLRDVGQGALQSLNHALLQAKRAGGDCVVDTVSETAAAA
ncbi:MAG: ATP-binding cassette domain-containing protein [Gemmatimonadetes bacterium]|nr:ATP-binding cassette domain-containing protein [Gemmatimonadota bacterium]